MVLLAATGDAAYSFGFMFVICDVGQRVTNTFDKLFDEVIQWHWHSFPKEIRRILPIVLIDLQQPVVIRFFGNFSCCRKTFKKVCFVNE